MLTIKIKRAVTFCVFAVLFGSPLAVHAQANFSHLCNAENLRATMCTARVGNPGDTSGMCQPALNKVLETQCKIVVELMTIEVPFDGEQKQLEQQVKAVARATRRVIDSVVPNTKDNVTVYNAIQVVVNEGAQVLIGAALKKIFDEATEGKISPNKFSDVLFELIGVFRNIIKVSILPSPEFANACQTSVDSGNLPRFMSNPKTCRTVFQVSLDLVYNNLVALYGIHSSDPKKITKGILGLTNTTAGIWADNIDLIADIGQTNAKIREREAQAIVFDYASDYWLQRATAERPYPLAHREDFLNTCFNEVDKQVRLVPSFFFWALRLHDSQDLRGTVNGFCALEYVRWKEFIEAGRYDALLIALANRNKVGYDEAVTKWFAPTQTSHYENAWSLFSNNSELGNTQTDRLLDHYQRAIDVGFIEGSAARAIFGAGNPGTFPLLASIFTELNEIDPGNNDIDEFFNCYGDVNNGLSPTYNDFATCMIRGLNLPVTHAPSEVVVGLYIWKGFSNYSRTDAFLKVNRIRNGPQGSDLGNQMSEYDMIRIGVRLRDNVVRGKRLSQARVN